MYLKRYGRGCLRWCDTIKMRNDDLTMLLNASNIAKVITSTAHIQILHLLPNWNAIFHIFQSTTFDNSCNTSQIHRFVLFIQLQLFFRQFFFAVVLSFSTNFPPSSNETCKKLILVFELFWRKTFYWLQKTAMCRIMSGEKKNGNSVPNVFKRPLGILHYLR